MQSINLFSNWLILVCSGLNLYIIECKIMNICILCFVTVVFNVLFSIFMDWLQDTGEEEVSFKFYSNYNFFFPQK